MRSMPNTKPHRHTHVHTDIVNCTSRVLNAVANKLYTRRHARFALRSHCAVPQFCQLQPASQLQNQCSRRRRRPFRRQQQQQQQRWRITSVLPFWALSGRPPSHHHKHQHAAWTAPLEVDRCCCTSGTERNFPMNQ